MVLYSFPPFAFYVPISFQALNFRGVFVGPFFSGFVLDNTTPRSAFVFPLIDVFPDLPTTFCPPLLSCVFFFTKAG